MRRWSTAIGVGALAVLTTLASPASAQICSTSCPEVTTTSSSTTTSSTTSSTSTSSTSTTSTTVQATTTTDAPPPAAVPAKTSNPTPQPGESVPISAPARSGNTAVLDNTKPSAAVLLPAGGGADIAMPAPKITQNANGSITVEVTVPPGTPAGVYIIAIVGTDSRGVSRAIIVPVVVRTRARTASVPTTTPPLTTSSVVVPGDVRKVVASIASAGGAAAVEDAVLHDGAELTIQNSQLIVSRPGDDAGKDSRPLVAAFAVALAGGGLVLLRRRTPVISKRSR